MCRLRTTSASGVLPISLAEWSLLVAAKLCHLAQPQLQIRQRSTSHSSHSSWLPPAPTTTTTTRTVQTSRLSRPIRTTWVISCWKKSRKLCLWHHQLPFSSTRARPQEWEVKIKMMARQALQSTSSIAALNLRSQSTQTRRYKRHIKQRRSRDTMSWRRAASSKCQGSSTLNNPSRSNTWQTDQILETKTHTFCSPNYSTMTDDLTHTHTNLPVVYQK